MEGTQKTVENFGENVTFSCGNRWKSGALAGMYIFHHKTLHKKFTIGVPLILVIQVMIFICIMENFYR